MTIQEELKARNLPQVVTDGMTADDWPAHRKELIGLFAREEYGISPPPPDWVRADVVSEDPQAWAGKALHRRIMLVLPTPKGEFSFPVDLVLPHCEMPVPLFVHISFFPYPGGPYTPMEELVDHGYGVAMLSYNDVTEDRDDGFTSGLAGMFDRDGDDGTQWGKIAMWAWAASRVMDHVRTLPQVDAGRIVAIGHSRLGKTALWCAAQDERFAAAVSNNSGASGAAVMRGKVGEDVQRISTVFPHWFCGNYSRYGGREWEMPFDQHQLLASFAPRPVYVSSALEDGWADPASEFLSCVAASGAYALLGRKGLVHRGEAAVPGDVFPEGSIGYHLRTGTHFLSRQDWQLFMAYLDRHLG